MSSNVFNKYATVCRKTNSKVKSTHVMMTPKNGFINEASEASSDNCDETYIDMNSSKLFQFIDLYLNDLKANRSSNDLRRKTKMIFQASYDCNVPLTFDISLEHDKVESEYDEQIYDDLEKFMMTNLTEFIENHINDNSINYITKMHLYTCVFFLSDCNTNTRTCIRAIFPYLRMKVDDAVEKLSVFQSFISLKLSRDFTHMNFTNLYQSFLKLNVYEKGCYMYGSWDLSLSYRLVDPNVYNIYENDANGYHNNMNKSKFEFKLLDKNVTDYILNTYSGYNQFRPVNNTDKYITPMNVMSELQDKHGYSYLYFIAMSPNYNCSYVFSSSKLQKEKPNDENVEYEPDDDKKIFEDLMDLVTVKSKMMNKENIWLDVGNVCNNIYDTTTALENWINYTDNLSTQFTKEDCNERFNNLTNKIVTVKTIAYHIRLNITVSYIEWQNKWIRSAFYKLDVFNDFRIGEIFYRMYWLDYACIFSQQNSTWYYFNDHRWVKMSGIIQLTKSMNGGFQKKIKEHIRELLTDSANNTSQAGMKELINNKVKEFNKVLKDVGFFAYQRRLSQVMVGFHDDILSKLDHNSNLFAFEDCVVECIGNRTIIRDGCPEDYIYRFVPHKYPESYTMDHPNVKMLLNYYDQLFDDKDLIMFVRKLHSSRLLSGNRDKKFVFEIGPPGGSKSQFKKLRDLAFGKGNENFSFTFDNTVMTAKKITRGGPTSEIDMVVGKRIAFFCEFNVNEKLEADGLLKTFSGADDFFSRSCNENGGVRKTTFMMFFQSNDPPSIGCCDSAIKDRFIYVPFLSKWTLDAPKDPKEQKKRRNYIRDNSFESQLAYMAPAFLWLMVKDYTRYIDEGIEMPDISKKYVKKYWEENDIYYRFLRHNGVVKTDDNKDILELSELFAIFQDWFRHEYPTENDVDRKRFSYEMRDENRLGDFHQDNSSFWVGWKMNDVREIGN